MSGTDWRESLNTAQRRAAEHVAGPLIVLAGPGTGKTFVIVARLRRLISEGADPTSILALTFSVKAAAEMRSRLAAAVGARHAEQVMACTFHSFGHTLMRRFGDYIGLRRDATIMDSAPQRRLLRRLIREHDLFGFYAARGRDEAIDGAMRFIAACRQSARTPAEAVRFARLVASRWKMHQAKLDTDAIAAAGEEALLFEHRARLFEAYDAACVERGLMTYDDFLTLPLRIFAERPVTASFVRDDYRHVVVDEFQDVNRAQIELLRHVAPPTLPSGKPPDLCVVGDDDQAIYGFRGADSAAFARFADIWPGHQTIALSANYRSGSSIIAAANAHIARAASRFAPDKRIDAAGREGRPPTPGIVEGVNLDDDKHAGLAIVAMIRRARERVGADGAPQAYSSFGVIASANSTVAQLAAVLEMHGVPVAIRQRTTPTDDPGVQDLLAWMHLLAGHASAEASVGARRLLLRPPFLVPAERVNRWQKDFDRQSTWRSEAERVPFMDWLRDRVDEDAGLARFIRLADELRGFALAHDAQTTVTRIVVRAELAHAENLPVHERAARVSNLASVMRWAQSRQPYLDEPGDLGALLAYYAELNEEERSFVSPSESRLDASDDDPAPGAPDAPDAVWLMTAHKSKGLEFDTVFVAKCRPGGFPMSSREREDDGVPDDFKGQPTPDRDDEQRRLFYVACTRAQRRLVLLARKKKSMGDAVDYFFELTRQSPGVKIDEHDGGAMIRDSGLSPDAADAATDQASEAHRRDEALSKEAAWIRQCAYEALHESADASLDDEALAVAARRLGDAAAALRAVERLRAGGDAPRDLNPPFDERLHALAAKLRAGIPASGRVLRVLTPPLALSFSAIKAYEKCPRCFYAKHVEGLRGPSSPGIDIGRVVHVALERFHRESKEAEKNEIDGPGLDRLLKIGEEEILGGGPDAESFNPAMLEQALAQLRCFHETFTDDATQVLAVESKIEFLYPDPDETGVLHRFVAKIDRMDAPPGGGVRIVDYKTGDALKYLTDPKKDDLQLSIYAIAAAVSEFGEKQSVVYDPSKHAAPRDGRAEYWLLATGQRGAIDLERLDLSKARKAIDAAIRGMRAGDWSKGKDCEGLCDWLPAAEA